MPKYEYKVLVGCPNGVHLEKYASEELKKEIGPGSYERKLNEMGAWGWQIINSNTTTVGSLFSKRLLTTTVLQREVSESK
jgi:hypothetical protein